MENTEVENIYYVVSIVALSLSTIIAIIALVCSQRALTKELREANKRMMTKLQYNYELQTKQARETFFAEYTKRYQDIILHLPDSDKDPQWLKYMRLYFDLCSEEYHLYKNKLIDEDVWLLWVDGMQEAMKRPSFRKAWEHPLGQHYSDSSFVSFMHHDVIGSEERKP